MNTPDALPAYSKDNESAFRREVEQADKQNLKRRQVVDQLLLRAPNGTVYQVVVSNAGALSATAF
jgi:hypothetical protein